MKIYSKLYWSDNDWTILFLQSIIRIMSLRDSFIPPSAASDEKMTIMSLVAHFAKQSPPKRAEMTFRRSLRRKKLFLQQLIATLILITLASCAPAVSVTPTTRVATPDADFDRWSATQEAKWVECEALDKLALIGRQALLPGAVISGPATINPEPYLDNIIYLAAALKMDMLAKGGLIVFTGHSVKIPEKLDVGKDEPAWVPTGYVVFYKSDKLMRDDMICWTAATSP
jgi:hypothetical protein